MKQKNIKYSLISCLACFALMATSCAPKEEEIGDDPSTETPVDGTPSALYVENARDTKADVTVTVVGVLSGQTVALYSDSNCQTQLAQGVASGSTIDFELTGLSSGVHNFYAKSESGACSTATISYEYVQCPAGYIRIPGAPSRGVAPFCVMQFEAKNVSSVATSQANLAPWTNVSAEEAKSNCRALNSGGNTYYDLISNQEWMTIADDAYAVADNWHNGNVNSYLSYGNSNNEKTPMAVSDESDPWSGVTLAGNPTTNHEYRRTHVLSNAAVLWDFAGNAAEIVDYGTQSTYTSPPACVVGANADRDAKSILDNNYCPALGTTHYMPTNPGNSYSLQYVGSFYGSLDSGRALSRGGGYNFMNRSGLYGLRYSTQDTATALGSIFGFRCVYRLNPLVRMSLDWAKDFDSTPDITVSGVQYGHTVSLYSDANCSTLVASKKSQGTSVTLTTSTLSAGSYNFYYKIKDRNDVTSACSVTSIAYEVASCPTDYLPIPGDKVKNVSPFCVMAYESRINGGTTASSYPSTNVSGRFAKDTCLGLNSGGTKYNLISNLEWMTIADQIASVASNWSSGVVGTGEMNKGNWNANDTVRAISDTTNHWDGMTADHVPTTEFKYRRTHYLPSGQVIWDFSGNAEEVIDYDSGTTGASYQLAPACTVGDGTTSYQLASVAANSQCTNIDSSHYVPARSSDNNTQGTGVFFPHTASSVLLRGGSYAMADDIGIYTLKMKNVTATTNLGTDVGYRCVYRP
ncbi:hypothetical protein [Bdellovibrio sp. ArHS]|uniref:hypothetical protein n=1 Tax=Bdellovibrio sp. ArHS TaxID=1569284 RepID=UPI0025B7E9F4|nr:hypothetical protein [Bdellovibrio sp. ArHS]